jgi:Prion-inhibition and propagation
MVDPGTGLSIASLVLQVFSGCIAGLVLLSKVRRLGKHANEIRCRLNLQEYRLVEWARHAGVAGPKGTLNTNLNETRIYEALLQLQELVTDADQLKKRYGLEDVSSVSQAALVTGIKEDKNDSFGGILKALVSEDDRKRFLDIGRDIRHKNTTISKFRWAIRDRQKFDELLSRIDFYVGILCDLLDSSQLAQLLQTTNAVLGRLLVLESRIEEVKGFEKAITASRLLVSAPLASAAAVKVLRTELNVDEDVPSLGVSALLEPRIKADTTPATTGMKLRSRESYKAFEPLGGASDFGLAQYENRPVFVERKSNPPSKTSMSIITTRARNLATLLNKDKHASFRTLHCESLIEEEDRFVFIFRHPFAETRPPRNLLELLKISRHFTPSVTDRIRLALDLAKAVHQLHLAGWLHKNLRSENVLFFAPLGSPSSYMSLQNPYLAGFSYARVDSPKEISERQVDDLDKDLYRHAQALGEPSRKFNKLMDVYVELFALIELPELQTIPSYTQRTMGY